MNALDRLRQSIARWLMDDVTLTRLRVHELKVGEHTVTIGASEIRFPDAGADPGTAGYFQRYGALLKFHNGTGAQTLGVVATNSYVGDSTDNRAIAHGLSVIPKLVMLEWTANTDIYFIYGNDSGRIRWHSSTNGAINTVTAMTNTNFYVGNSAGYSASANYTGETYGWVAFG